MALPVQEQVKYWGIAAVIFVVVLWFLGDVMLPFVLGGAIAYCLDPIADRFERIGFSRVWATIVITLLAVVAFLLVFILIIPSLVQQAIALFNAAPELFQRLQNFLTERFPQLMDDTSAARQTLLSIGDTIKSKGGELLNGLVASALNILNVAVLIVVVPVVTFYLLLDWDRMVAEIDRLLPRDHAPTVRRIAREIDQTLAAFIRGQGTVMLILGTFYAVGLMVVGLQFGMVIGAVAGLISFIPYIGAIVGGGLALGIAVFQFWGDWWMIAAVGGIFAAGQMIEGNFLTPKLVGGSVGLHPVWLLFALSAFGVLFGFVGLLVAVPVAAAFGVIARFAIEQYKDGRLYKGVAGRDE